MLKLGKMTSRELAQWFNISYNTYKNKINKYLEVLENYCEFDKIYGGVNIKEIYVEEYDKTLNFKDDKLYLEEIQRCVETQDGLSTIAGMSRKLCQQGEYQSVRTARYRLGKSKSRLFGNPKELISSGTSGTSQYLWAIKIDNYNRYRLMSEEEQNILNNIIASIYTSDTSYEDIKKCALLDDLLRTNEIDVQEYFEQKDQITSGNFVSCLFQFKEVTGLTLVRCTRHEIINLIDFDEEFYM